MYILYFPLSHLFKLPLYKPLYNYTNIKFTNKKPHFLLIGSALRFIRGEEVHTGIPTITLNRPKTLGKIVTIQRNVVLTKCKVLKKASYYWSDTLGEGWKSLLEKSNYKLFEIRATSNDVTLEVSQS